MKLLRVDKVNDISRNRNINLKNINWYAYIIKDMQVNIVLIINAVFISDVIP